jgi:ribosomal protein S18 acetylase RimI-like enzyme
MVKSQIKKVDLSFRPAKPADADVASQLIFATFPKVATFIIGLGNEDRAKKILARIFPMEGHRFSFEYSEIVQYQGRVIGILVAFPGRKLGRLDRRMSGMLLRQYRLRGKLTLIIRAWPMVFINEASRDEYLLSNLAVKKRYRGKGVGSLMLSHVEDRAKEAGLSKVALNVAIENQSARRLYERHGYKIKTVHLEPNKRVPYVGAGHRRMVKELSE